MAAIGKTAWGLGGPFLDACAKAGLIPPGTRSVRITAEINNVVIVEADYLANKDALEWSIKEWQKQGAELCQQ